MDQSTPQTGGAAARKQWPKFVLVELIGFFSMHFAMLPPSLVKLFTDQNAEKL